jgi:hypothetical protein
MTMRIAGRHAIDLRDANGVRRSTYKARKCRGHRMAIETISPPWLIEIIRENGFGCF